MTKDDVMKLLVAGLMALARITPPKGFEWELRLIKSPSENTEGK